MSRALTVTEPADPGAALRTPPHNYEAERAVLGAIFMNPRAMERVAETLVPEHFADPVNGRIYECCLKLFSQNVRTNPITLKPFLEKDELLIAVGGMKYLASLAAATVTVINALDYAKTIEDLWRRRLLMEIGDELATAACFPDPDTNAKAIQETHEARLNALAKGSSGSKRKNMRQALMDTVARWEEASKTGLVGSSYGFPQVDYRAGLMQDGQLIIIAARPSMGKTALARAIAMNAARKYYDEALMNGTAPKKVLFFTAEMATEQQAGAVLTGMTGIMPPKAMGDITGEIATLMDAAEAVADLPIEWEDSSGITPSHVLSVARQVSREPGGLGKIIIDYMQLMNPERGMRGMDSANDRVSYLSKSLKEIARVLNVPVIALSQLSRAVEQRENKRPMLSDLRDSGSIEQDADVIMFVYREQYYLERDTPQQRDKETTEQFSTRSTRYQDQLAKCENKAEVIAAKVRLGAIGTAILNWDGQRMMFSDPKAERGPYLAIAKQETFELGDKT